MASIRDILGDETDKLQRQFYDKGMKYEQVRESMIKLAQSVQKENKLKTQYGEMADDGIFPSLQRGVSTNIARAKSMYNGVFNATPFDLSTDEEDAENTQFIEDMESIKQTTSRKGISPTRQKELKQLDTQSQNAKTSWENIVAGVDTMVDTATHPSEWTTQGVVEMLSDPLNAVSFGAGGLASKLGRTMFQKGLIGGGAGAIEGVSVNSASEYIIAKGQNKSDDEATKIALQSAGGGAVAGGGFGTFGGIVSKNSRPIKLEKTAVSDILDNELLKTNEGKALSPDEVNTKLKEAFGNYPKVEEQFRSESAGVNKYSVHPEEKSKPNFQMVYENLPVVRASKEIIPFKLRELVDVELIDPEQAKQIELKTQKMITHKDVIYADFTGWVENISQDIIDGINAKKINDMQKAQDISSKAVEQSKLITSELVKQGADIVTIKDEINKQLIPTKEEKAMIQIVNDSMPVENRMSGFRLRDIVLNTFEGAEGRADELKMILKRGGIVDEFSNVIIESILNKNIDVFDDFVVNKVGAKSENETKALKQIIVKDLEDANVGDKTADKQNISLGKENGDSTGDTKLGADGKQRVVKGVSSNDGRDIGASGGDVAVSNANKPMGEQSTVTDIDRVVSEFDRDEVVSSKEQKGFESIRDGFEKFIKNKDEDIEIFHYSDEEIQNTNTRFDEKTISKYIPMADNFKSKRFDEAIKNLGEC